MRHTFEAHSSVPNFRFTCGVEGCSQTFVTYSAMKSHLARKHRGIDLEEVQVIPGSVRSDTFYHCDDNDSDACMPEIQSMRSGVKEDAPLQGSAAMFLLSLKEKHQNTQKAVDFAVGQVQEMVSYSMQDIRDSVLRTLEEHSLATGSELPDISSCFEVRDPFDGLQTEYMQTKYYREHFDLVVSLCVPSLSKYPLNVQLYYRSQ